MPAKCWMPAMPFPAAWVTTVCKSAPAWATTRLPLHAIWVKERPGIKHQARKPLIGKDEIGAFAQDEGRQAARLGPRHGLGEFGGGGGFAEPTRWAAHLEGNEGRQGNVFAEGEGHRTIVA